MAGLLDFYRFESDKAPASSNGRVGLVSGIDLRIGLSSAKPRHFFAQAAVINEDEAHRIEIELAVEPVLEAAAVSRIQLAACR